MACIGTMHNDDERFGPPCHWPCNPASHSKGSLTDCFRSKNATEDLDACLRQGKIVNGESEMPDVTIVYWRDIPAQVIVGKGRRGSKRQLPERFEQAIDRAAMKVNAKDADAYLAEWRKAPTYEMDGDPDQIAEAEATRLDTEYDTARIKALIDNEGWA
ncbi:hypothetical protein DSM107133_01983 [Pseudosulfitobacter sp. DSM 107133]|nr:hypothetical protein DSM107133_01983 [Pseudosulfitobacter sp. DSM 107133]